MNKIVRNQSETCQKHNKLPDILIVKEAKYICQDCAIFDPRYRHEHMMEKESIFQKIQQITIQCNQLTEKQNCLYSSIDQKIKSLIHIIQHQQVSVINQINNQFMEVKMIVSEVYLRNVQAMDQQKKRNTKQKVDQLMREKFDEQKIKKHYERSGEIKFLRELMKEDMARINKVFEAMKQQIQQNLTVKINVLEAFQPLFEFKLNQTTQKQLSFQQNDQNLLDFSDLLIPIEQNQQEESINFSIQSSQFPIKLHSVERMKTSACLEDSMCSEVSVTKSFESQVLALAISEIAINDEKESLLSERSISCLSTVSKYQTSASTSSKKSTIVINSLQQISTKLLSIPPTTKSIKLSNFPMTCQEFSQLMKQKISRSFINSLEIVNCPKLNDKILLEIKAHKCKSLKKVEIKDCKEFNWGDKKVMEMVKKLEIEGVKIFF